MFGENDVRRRAAPISSAMEWNALLNIASSMGSVCADIDHHVEEGVELDATIGRHERGRTVFGHNRRSREDVTGSELLAIVDTARYPASVAMDLLLTHDRVCDVAQFLVFRTRGSDLARENRAQ